MRRRESRVERRGSIERVVEGGRRSIELEEIVMGLMRGAWSPTRLRRLSFRVEAD